MWIYTPLLVLLLSNAAFLEASNVFGLLRNQRIVNGRPIDIKVAPWQVALLNNSEHFCGGSIVSGDIIITAAECLRNRISIAQLTVRAGSANWNSGGQLAKVDDYRIHEHHGSETHENDIAVLKLVRPLRLGPSVQIIALATESPEHGSDAYVSGWGIRKVRRECARPTELHGVSLKIVERKTCALSKYSLIGWEITKDMICATDQGRDACGNDLGGPLVSKAQLVGVVSWAEGCAKPGYPGVYANVAYFHAWLQKAIAELQNNYTTEQSESV
ncbi:trypsin alpha-3-like [Drosophila montana]|uniref:trypsin alpha-3-like n=1 Tax=Drosophila montana TaxID=40370 RepID=UPI00313E1B7C